MRVASIQIRVVENDKAATIDKARALLRRARGADLAILPELWNIGFMSFDRYLPEAEEENGPTLSAMRELAREMRIHLHTGSFVEREQDRFYNTSCLLSPDGTILAKYRKIHLYGHRSEETRLLSPGERVVVADTPLGRIGLATCYDLRFPELFRRMVEQGAEIFLVCSAWPYPRLEHWILFNRTRAVENQCFLVSANSVGPNRGAAFVGHSMMVDPWGVILAGAGDDEAIAAGEIDLERLKDARGRFPALADRQAWLNRPV
jgi:predicted amidohydrolase